MVYIFKKNDKKNLQKIICPVRPKNTADTLHNTITNNISKNNFFLVMLKSLKVYFDILRIFVFIMTKEDVYKAFEITSFPSFLSTF